MNKNPLIGLTAALLLSLGAASATAADYLIDTKGAHAFIQFKIAHLGYSWLLGRFNSFSGEFSYDEQNPAAARVRVEIDTASVDSNHAERDKHLRSADFFDVAQYPKASFVSTGFKPLGDGKAELTGDFSLHGITRPISIAVTPIGHGPDPWGGYRRGFEGRTRFALADFGITRNLGPASKEVEIYLSLEGVRQ
ncbi:MAG: YceI family protein [Gammaproteobacteria bacterium]|nr:YceI family protein [Gammaproteobacteria bacterium]MBU1654878.1 YceI family protein [Gammaproteobacteria bacterium]MBU1960569.1 YceI family protein [Gammaproteobacteria bacterium]